MLFFAENTNDDRIQRIISYLHQPDFAADLSVRAYVRDLTLSYWGLEKERYDEQFRKRCKEHDGNRC